MFYINLFVSEHVIIIYIIRIIPFTPIPVLFTTIPGEGPASDPSSNRRLPLGDSSCHPWVNGPALVTTVAQLNALGEQAPVLGTTAGQLELGLGLGWG